MNKLLILLALTLTAGGCGSSSESVVPTKPVSTVMAYTGDSIVANWAPLPDGILDFGIGGQDTVAIEARFDSGVMASGPGTVIIGGGVNDLLHGLGVDISHVAAMAAEARAAGCRVLITSVLLPNEPSWSFYGITKSEVDEWNEQLKALAKQKHYTYVDYYDVMLDADGNADLSLLISDGLHPNADGYVRMTEVLEAALKSADVTQ